MKNSFLLFVLAIPLALAGCKKAPNDSYEVKSTGIKGSYFWCDANHMVASFRELPVGRTFKNIYFDAAHPEQAQTIVATDEHGKTLKPAVVGCENNTLLFYAYGTGDSPDPDYRGDLYVMQMGKPAQLLFAPKDPLSPLGEHAVSLSGKYLIEGTPRIVKGDTYATDPVCTKYVHPDFKALCWDVKDSYVIALSRFVIASYLWQDRIPVSISTGEARMVNNPQKQLKDEAGEPIPNGMFLHDLDNKVLARLDSDPRYVTSPGAYSTDPQQTWLYSPCKPISTTKDTTSFDRVCRYPLNAPEGKPRAWEEVFAFDLPDKFRNPVQHLSTDAAGNIYFDLADMRGKDGGIWKFDAAQRKFQHVITGSDDAMDSQPSISPDGKTLAFVRDSVLQIAHEKEKLK